MGLLLCFIGLHKWGQWNKLVTIAVFKDSFAPYYIGRRCLRCDIKQISKV